MIQAWIFDLDGTLVQTERLKAQSYAKAAVELCPQEISEDQVIAKFKAVVGRSRAEVAQALVEEFGLQDKARQRMAEFGVSTPWQAFVQVRLGHYRAMLADPDVLQSSQWPHNRALLERARAAGCKTGLATMSTCEQASKVLGILGLQQAFDFIATRDDVEHGKPDPEIYRLVAAALNVSPSACMVIEDSPAGVQAALGGGMHVLAVSTPFTRAALHGSCLLPEERIVDDPQALPQAVERLLREAG